MVRIGLVDPNGINGDGEIITLVFLSIQSGGSSPYTLELVEASDTDLRDLVVQVNSSEFSGVGEPFTSPALVFRPCCCFSSRHNHNPSYDQLGQYPC